MTGRGNSAPVRDSARAWLVVAAAFAALFVVFGVAFSFGAFSAEFGTGRLPRSCFR